MSLQPDYIVLNFLVRADLEMNSPRSHSHPQRPGILATFICTGILEESHLHQLRGAVCNPHIARALREDTDAYALLADMAQVLTEVRPHMVLGSIYEDILKGMRGWERLDRIVAGVPSGAENGLEEGWFDHAENGYLTWLLDFFSHTHGFSSFLLHAVSIASPIPSSVPLPTFISSDPNLGPSSRVSDDSNLALLRATQAVASTVVVLCWSIRNENHSLAQRALAVLGLWRVHGFEEVRFPEHACGC